MHFNIHTSKSCLRLQTGMGFQKKTKTFSIFDDVLSLEVETLSLLCLDNLFQILTPEILSD